MVALGWALVAASSMYPAAAISGQPGIDSDVRTPQVRIIGGNTANRADTGWFLQLTPRFEGESFLCGATAIAPRWAVTVAHCVKRSRHSVAEKGVKGSYVQTNPVRRDVGVRHYLDKIIVHPDYRPESIAQFNDIALLHSMTPFGGATLPVNEVRDLPAAETAEQAYGFGETVGGDPGTVTGQLRVANVEDLAGPDNPICGSYEKNYNPNHQICAGVAGGGVDACQGDSGGALVANLASGPALAGMVSVGTGCALPEFPGIYTRISAYAPWIHAHIDPRFEYSRPCAKRICPFNRGHELRIKITNPTQQAGQWATKRNRDKLKLSKPKGSLEPKKSVRISVRAATWKPACAVLKMYATGGTPLKRFVFALNGKHGCRRLLL